MYFFHTNHDEKMKWGIIIGRETNLKATVFDERKFPMDLFLQTNNFRYLERKLWQIKKVFRMEFERKWLKTDYEIFILTDIPVRSISRYYHHVHFNLHPEYVNSGPDTSSRRYIVELIAPNVFKLFQNVHITANCIRFHCINDKIKESAQ